MPKMQQKPQISKIRTVTMNVSLTRLPNLFQDEFEIFAISDDPTKPNTIIGVIKGPLKTATRSDPEKLFLNFIDSLKTQTCSGQCITGSDCKGC